MVELLHELGQILDRKDTDELTIKQVNEAIRKLIDPVINPPEPIKLDDNLLDEWINGEVKK